MTTDADGRNVFILFFNDTATTEIYTLSLHDALPIFEVKRELLSTIGDAVPDAHLATTTSSLQVGAIAEASGHPSQDRKSTRLNSSHANISYAVFCLKKE